MQGARCGGAAQLVGSAGQMAVMSGGLRLRRRGGGGSGVFIQLCVETRAGLGSCYLGLSIHKTTVLPLTSNLQSHAASCYQSRATL